MLGGIESIRQLASKHSTESARCVKVWVMALGGEEVRRRVELVGSGLIRMTALTAVLLLLSVQCARLGSIRTSLG